MQKFRSTNGDGKQLRGRIIPLPPDIPLTLEVLELQSTSEPPRPLMREMPPADPFPIDALGDLAAAARGIHERTQAPLATCGQSVLAAATLAVQGLANIELPTRQVRPTSCFFVTVAATGERKTSVDTEALRPIRRQESDLREEHAELALHYQNDLAAWEKARDVAVKKAGGDRAAIRTALDRTGVKPKPPWLPVLIVEEPTYEGLCKLLAASRPSLGIFSNEGGQFVGGGMAWLTMPSCALPQACQHCGTAPPSSECGWMEQRSCLTVGCRRI